MAELIEKPAGPLSILIKVDGSEIPDTFQVTHINIENMLNRIPRCEIDLTDGDAADEDFPISDSKTFEPGAKIEVQLGYKGSTKKVFSGIILEQSITVQTEDSPMLKVISKDKVVKMTVGRKNEIYLKKKDSDVISTLIKNNGGTASVTNTTTQFEQMVQYYATDWDFMLARAEVNGMIVVVEDGKVSVMPPSKSAGDAGTITYGDDIYHFEAEVNAQDQYSTISSSAWDIKTQKITTKTAKPADYGTGNLSTSKLSGVLDVSDFGLQSGGFLDESALAAWAKGTATKSEMSKIMGSITFIGSSAPILAGTITLEGLGKRFNGKVYVSGVSHEVEDGQWSTTCQLGLSPEFFSESHRLEAPVASGVLPGSQGLMVGKIKKIAKDPDGNFRVQVELPLLQSKEPGVWARFSTFYASSGVGALFYPEVGDEVVVGFFNDDPRYPVVLGSMYSSKLKPPDEPDEKNNLKEIVTREKMKLSFDEKDKIITITTPGKNVITISDKDKGIVLKDQNSNKIEMSPSGIEINSPKKVTIKGTQGVDIQGLKIDMKGDQAIAGKAPQVQMTADMQLQLKSSAQASL
ncbi:MAG TPA: Rhs element Vgr protein, partial [Cytophagales bacterium]|nr:Rhs element Vgr protein [Cytophagales bacterium]